MSGSDASSAAVTWGLETDRAVRDRLRTPPPDAIRPSSGGYGGPGQKALGRIDSLVLDAGRYVGPVRSVLGSIGEIIGAVEAVTEAGSYLAGGAFKLGRQLEEARQAHRDAIAAEGEINAFSRGLAEGVRELFQAALDGPAAAAASYKLSECAIRLRVTHEDLVARSAELDARRIELRRRKEGLEQLLGDPRAMAALGIITTAPQVAAITDAADLSRLVGELERAALVLARAVDKLADEIDYLDNWDRALWNEAVRQGAAIEVRLGRVSPIRIYRSMVRSGPE